MSHQHEFTENLVCRGFGKCKKAWCWSVQQGKALTNTLWRVYTTQHTMIRSNIKYNMWWKWEEQWHFKAQISSTKCTQNVTMMMVSCCYCWRNVSWVIQRLSKRNKCQVSNPAEHGGIFWWSLMASECQHSSETSTQMGRQRVTVIS